MNKGETEMKKFNPRRLLALAYFWHYGMIGIAFVLPIILGAIFYYNEVLHSYTPMVFLISMGLPCCAIGLDCILGCIFEFDHLILIDQSSSHQKMNPYDLTWNVSKKEFVFIGCIFLFFGLAEIILAVFV